METAGRYCKFLHKSGTFPNTKKYVKRICLKFIGYN